MSHSRPTPHYTHQTFLLDDFWLNTQSCCHQTLSFSIFFHYLLVKLPWVMLMIAKKSLISVIFYRPTSSKSLGPTESTSAVPLKTFFSFLFFFSLSFFFFSSMIGFLVQVFFLSTLVSRQSSKLRYHSCNNTQPFMSLKECEFFNQIYHHSYPSSATFQLCVQCRVPSCWASVSRTDTWLVFCEAIKW